MCIFTKYIWKDNQQKCGYDIGVYEEGNHDEASGIGWKLFTEYSYLEFSSICTYINLKND
jgi:hypothetical protein